MNFFERHADKWTPEPNSGCWLWFGSQITSGYGNLTLHRESLYAHRQAFETANGEGSATGKVIRHRCDNPCCINPEHLLAGTAKDNVDDMWERGRAKTAHVYGEAHGKTALTNNDIAAIRAETGSLSGIAARHGISKSTAWRIRTRKVWGHI